MGLSRQKRGTASRSVGSAGVTGARNRCLSCHLRLLTLDIPTFGLCFPPCVGPAEKALVLTRVAGRSGISYFSEVILCVCVRIGWMGMD